MGIVIFIGPLWGQRAVALEDLVHLYLWPRSPADFQRAEAALEKDTTFSDADRIRFHNLEEILRQGRSDYSPVPSAFDGQIPQQTISVELPEGVSIPVLVQLPPYYTPEKYWPLVFAMHGGPPGTTEQALRSAQRMINVWTDAAAKAGWIVAAPAMITAVTAGMRNEQRLPYEIFHQEQIQSVILALRDRFRINPDRIVSTGISLGSNFSIALAGSHPDWLSAIVPVSTEGDSREHLLRNVAMVPVYILEGSLDKNIWGIGGPQALQSILARFNCDLTYREFSGRAHEGFQEHYGDVLRWLDGRARQAYPRRIIRVPHPGIMPVDRRVYWMEADTRQAFVRADVVSSSRIEITTRWARALKIYLHDRLVNMDRPVEIWVNGVKAFSGEVKRSFPTALRQARLLGDERRIYAAEIEVEVPASASSLKVGQQLWDKFAPQHPDKDLSFWERYATRALTERFPSLGFTGAEEKLPKGIESVPEQIAIRITDVSGGSAVAEAGLKRDDILLEVDGEPFYKRDNSLGILYHWLIRELRTQPKTYPLLVWRNGELLKLEAHFKLGPYTSQ